VYFVREIIIDNFAGGGGASTGIGLAIGRSVDIAINHDPAAIAMHKANHPDTKHYCESVWEVDPVEAADGRPVALCWFSPDCKHFSKAKGGKPVEKNIRGLAWVAVKWAKQVKPRVIILENVEEFKTWGPLLVDGHPDPDKKGETFRLFVKALKRQGYKVDYRELRASDYGAPTTRKRFFLIARCDGKAIVWPQPTHGNPDSLEVHCGLLKPWRTAAEIIDWNLPCPSIFERKKPLAENTLRRIARGIKKFVLDNQEPFIVEVNHTGSDFRGQKTSDPLHTVTAKHGYGLITPTLMVNEFNNVGGSPKEPLKTILTGNHHYLVAPVISQIGQTGGGDRLHDIEEPLSTIVSKAEHMLVSPTLIQMGYGEAPNQEPRVPGLDKPLGTVVAGGRKHALVSAFISKYYEGNYKGAGADLNSPTPTITTKDHNAIVATHLIQMNNHCDGRSLNEPIPTIVAGPGHLGEVRTFLLKYYGADIGLGCNEPLHTVTTKDRFGLVTVQGEEYQIVDIGMRMLEPKELFAAQGFPDDYIIDRDNEGKSYPKTAQVARCGNAVPPPFAEALVRSNLPDLCSQKDELCQII
jgi:DNA (cytosine-5)-methyltransferase 1